MGTLGKYLRHAREARGIDLRDAAQQTRIGINYLKALEEDNFAKLPGEVFVKGFLRNYAKFLRLEEAEVMNKYGEMKLPQPAAGTAVETVPVVVAAAEDKPSHVTSFEPFLWAAGIVIALGVFLFTALPERQSRESQNTVAPSPSGYLNPASVPAPVPEKLYLEVIAMENTWLLVRTDTSPQKKAVLKKGESLIWSADERFLLSYGSVGALKLLLNGQELTVNEPRNAVVRDLVITATGVVSRKTQQELAKPLRPKKPVTGMKQDRPSGQATPTTQGAPAAVPQEQPKVTTPEPLNPAVSPSQ